MRKLFWAVILAAAVLLPTLASGEGLSVRLRASAQVAGAQIRLGDVAHVTGGSLIEKKRASALRLAASPAHGRSARVMRRSVERLLRRAGLAGAKVSGAMRVVVRRAGRVLRAGDVTAAVRRFLARRLPLRTGDVELRSVSVPARMIPLPRHAVRYQVEMPPNTRLVGKIPLIVRILGRGGSRQKVLNRVWVTADIAVYARVPIARRALRARQRLAASMFEMRRRNLSEVPSDAVSKLSDLEDAHLLRSLAPGEIVRTSDLKLPHLVKQGHLVRILARRGALQITAVGKSLDMGRKGEMVRVLNIDSKKLIHGRVLSRSSVEVLF